VLGTVSAAVLAALFATHTASIDIVSSAAGIPTNAQATGVAKFVNGANALISPALIMAAAIAPLSLIAGGAMMLFGGRRGMMVIGTSLGVLLLIGSVKALIA